MTKRKRTPPPSPPTRASVLQIPASLQRLSLLSRSLAFQADNLASDGQDTQSADAVAQAQAVSGIAPAEMAPVNINSSNGQNQGFKAFAPSKQPTFPVTQTWVEPKARAVPTPDAAGFMPPTQPSFPQGQAWPQPQFRKAVVPPPHLAPHPNAPQTTPIHLDPAPMNGEPLCLETQPHLVAALIAQKRAANEANRKREAWTKKASQHRRSQRPDDQLISELNQTLESPYTQDTPTPGPVPTINRISSGARSPGQFVIPTLAITFDPTIPNAAPAAETGSAASQPSHGPTSGYSKRRPNTHSEHDSLFSSVESTPAPTESVKQAIAQVQNDPRRQPHQESIHAQLSAAASTIPARVSLPAQSQANPFNLGSMSNQADPSSVHQPPQGNNTPTPIAAEHYRFDPRRWQTSSNNRQQQQQYGANGSGQAVFPAAPTQNAPQGHYRIELDQRSGVAKQSTPKGRAATSSFRNLTKDKFGRFGAGGKMTDMSVGQSNGGGQ